MGPNNWGIFLILPATTGKGIGPAGEISPVVYMLKNGLLQASLQIGTIILKMEVHIIKISEKFIALKVHSLSSQSR